MQYVLKHLAAAKLYVLQARTMKSWSSLRLGCRVIRQTYGAVSSRRSVASVGNDIGHSLSAPELNVVKSPYADISVPDVGLPEFVWEMVDKYPEHTALVSTDRQIHQTWLLTLRLLMSYIYMEYIFLMFLDHTQ